MMEVVPASAGDYNPTQEVADALALGHPHKKGPATPNHKVVALAKKVSFITAGT